LWQVLAHIEDKMREMVLRSHLLAAYLLETQMADLRGIVKDLGTASTCCCVLYFQ
jgi:hypothetical protein